MKVKELIKELEQFDKDTEVFLSNDIEGNAIKTIYQVAILQDGKFLPSKEGVEGAEFLGGKWLKWFDTKQLLTIYPTDTVVSN